MNQDLKQTINYYFTREHKEINALLLDKSKDNLVSIILDLLTTYANDKNSSTLREYITVSIAGYHHCEEKIGYNGYKQNSISSGQLIQCEAKPKNFDTKDLQKFKEGTRKTKSSKLNGGGNFTDYTFDRLDRDLKENPNMLISGFVDGRLIYILEFPFTSENFVNHLRIQLEKRFPDGDTSGQYLRSASFSYLHFFEGNKNLKVIYLLKKQDLENYKEYINKRFFHILLAFSKYEFSK